MRRRRANALMATAAGAAMSLAGCGSTAVSPTGAKGSGAALVSSARCAANHAAGTITYLTGFGWQSSVGILDPVAAQAQGFYRSMCLDVALESGNGDPTASSQLVASGRATIGELGSPSDAISASAAGIAVDAIATYGDTTASTLLTNPSITNLRQLDGKTLGYKGAMPPVLTAMLAKAGVDIASLKEVSVGYNPIILPQGKVAALTAYKSNEPIQLRDAGYKFKEWDPSSFGIHGAFNVLDVNRGFAHAHPSAVEDFLRATFEAYHWCESHTATCVADAHKHQPVGFDVKQNEQRWALETAEVDHTLLAGHGVGAESVAEWQPEYQLLLSDHLISRPVELTQIINTSYVEAIYHGSTLIWPGP